MFEREYREMSFVQRWGIIRRVREQSVAEHMYYVAIYAAQTADLIGWKGDRGELLKMALVHDLPEGGVGDIMGPAKRASGIGPALKVVEEQYMKGAFGDWPNQDHLEVRKVHEMKLIVKFADIMDETMFLATEKQMGNGTIGSFYGANIICPARQVYERLSKAWGRLLPITVNSHEVHRMQWGDIDSALISASRGNSFIIANPES